MPVTMATVLTTRCWPMKQWAVIWNTSFPSCALRSASSLATAWEERQRWQLPWCRWAAAKGHHEFITISHDIFHCTPLSSLNTVILFLLYGHYLLLFVFHILYLCVSSLSSLFIHLSLLTARFSREVSGCGHQSSTDHCTHQLSLLHPSHAGSESL